MESEMYLAHEKKKVRFSMTANKREGDFREIVLDMEISGTGRRGDVQKLYRKLNDAGCGIRDFVMEDVPEYPATEEE